MSLQTFAISIALQSGGFAVQLLSDFLDTSEKLATATALLLASAIAFAAQHYLSKKHHYLTCGHVKWI